MIPDGPVVCFGEILIRLSAPDHELLLQSPRLDVRFGGAEANVAVSLAHLGRTARMVSFVPDNRLGHAAIGELRRHGVDISEIAFAPGRMGLYFVSNGAVVRPSQVTYDRAGSAFAEADPNRVDWSSVLKGASLLHLSGVTPAIGRKAADAALRAARAARTMKIAVSFDGNYRETLWAAWDGDAPAILGALLACSDVAFIDDRDIARVLKREFAAADAMQRRREAARAAFETFADLKRIAATFRVQHTVDNHDLSAAMFLRDGREFLTLARPLVGIVDRIGAGDAFAAGLIYGLGRGLDDRDALELALALACLKHSVPGDFNLMDEVDAKAFLSDNAFGVRR